MGLRSQTFAAGAWLLAGGVALAAVTPAAAISRAPSGPRPCATKPFPTTSAAAHHSAAAPDTSRRDVWSFVSAPQLQPMRVRVVAHRPGTARGQIFVAPYSTGTMVGQTGSLIMDNTGSPVWFRPLSSTRLQNADFTVQTYRDPRTGRAQRVLTWWQGTLAIPPDYTNLPAGAPEPGGCYYIYDDHYRLLRTVFAKHGFNPDEHEFALTPQGTALFIASKAVRMDLRPFGGPKNGAIEDSEVQEVSLATGRLVFSWDMLAHVSPALSEEPASSASSSAGVWDAYHMNSVDIGPRGQLLISARNMWAVYDISKRTSRIRWQLGGKNSDFRFGPRASFFWQHDARFRPGHTISMFDDGCCALPDGKPEQQSHGLILHLDFRLHLATITRTYYHHPGLYSPSQGNLQALRNGNEFVGWGQNQYYSEYRSAGNTLGRGKRDLIYDAEMPSSNISYRAFRNVWIGLPSYPPSAAARVVHRHIVVYASWNGSTQTRAWQVLAGPRGHVRFAVVRYARRTGFETAIRVRSRGSVFRVRAIGPHGRVLGTSRVTKLQGKGIHG